MTKPRQISLTLHPRSSLPAKLYGYDEANLRSARIVLDNIQQFGGEHAGLVRWSHAVLARLSQKPATHLRNSRVFESISAQLFEGGNA
jgi:hypothetical protein